MLAHRIASCWPALAIVRMACNAWCGRRYRPRSTAASTVGLASACPARTITTPCMPPADHPRAPPTPSASPTTRALCTRQPWSSTPSPRSCATDLASRAGDPRLPPPRANRRHEHRVALPAPRRPPPSLHKILRYLHAQLSAAGMRIVDCVHIFGVQMVAGGVDALSRPRPHRLNRTAGRGPSRVTTDWLRRFRQRAAEPLAVDLFEPHRPPPPAVLLRPTRAAPRPRARRTASPTRGLPASPTTHTRRSATSPTLLRRITDTGARVGPRARLAEPTVVARPRLPHRALVAARPPARPR